MFQVQWTAGNPWERVLGGAGGIRTLDTLLAYTHFPGERLRPLGHRSACPGRHAPYRARHLFASVTFISGADQEILADGAFRYRSEERRVGKECVSTCRYRWLPSN